MYSILNNTQQAGVAPASPGYDPITLLLSYCCINQTEGEDLHPTMNSRILRQIIHTILLYCYSVLSSSVYIFRHLCLIRKIATSLLR